VDDILDEGNTLAAVKAYCIEQGAKSVYTAVLADKKHTRRLPGISADCAGLQLEDKFVFGSGLDYKGYLRNVAGIYAIDESALSEQP
jgi:hypoxanthine phosphoribosyltransferase